MLNTKSKKNVITGLLLLACIAIAMMCMSTVAYADSENPFLQVTCGSADKTGTGWSWDTDERVITVR